MQKFSDYYAGLSDSDKARLADTLGVTERYINYFLLGSNPKCKRRPSPALTQKISDATGLPVVAILADFFPSVERELHLMVYSARVGCSGADQSPAADNRTDQDATKGDQDHDHNQKVGGQGIGAATDQSDCRG